VIRFTQAPRTAKFDREILPHLDAAYSLARFLLRNDQDAEDVVQEAALRAFRFFDGFRGQNGRAWFLRIVRNTAFTNLKRAGIHSDEVPFDEELHTTEISDTGPAAMLDRAHDRETVRAAIDQLPAEFREVITLRELEGCSYKEIAEITSVPVGTVMSRLARARAQLIESLSKVYREQK
jgi:RNA polymerase sigma-70 factor (ECF subfamily)